MVKVVQSTDIPGIPTLEIFPLIKDIGYDGVDYLTYIHNFYKRPRKILELSERYNLSVLSLHQPKLLVPLHPKIFFQRMLDLISFFPDVQISNYHISGFMNILRRKPHMIEKFMQLAQKYNTSITFESNPNVLTFLYPHEVYIPEVFAEFCVSNNLSITMDTSHIADNGGDVLQFFKKYHKHIHLIHLSDYHNGTEHLPLGMGSLPIKELLQEMKRKSWKRIIVFEIKSFPGAKNKYDKIAQLRESLEIVRRYT